MLCITGDFGVAVMSGCHRECAYFPAIQLSTSGGVSGVGDMSSRAPDEFEELFPMFILPCLQSCSYLFAKGCHREHGHLSAASYVIRGDISDLIQVSWQLCC
jgi:hypothetical protein